MKLNIVLGYLVVCIMGILSIYAYDFFDIHYLNLIFPQNESLFEYTKIIFYPLVIYMIVDMLIIRKDNEAAFRSYVSGIFLAILFMIVSYYTYSGIIGQTFLYVDILIFLTSIFIAFYYRYKKIALFNGLSSLVIFIIILALLIIFTLFPGHISFFLSLR